MAGANRSLFALVTGLPREISPTVALADDGEVAEHYRAAGIQTVITEPPNTLAQYGNAMVRWSRGKRVWEAVHSLLPYTMRLRRLLRQLAIDVVHVNDMRGALMAGGAGRLAGCPIVGHLRGEVPLPGFPRRVFECVCDRIITVADSVQMCLSPRGRRKCCTVYNGIARGEVLRRADASPPIAWLQSLRDQGKIVVCCFASVVPFKGIHHLLDATVELNARGWGNRLAVVVVGDLIQEYAYYQHWLEERKTQFSADNLYFAGWHPNPFPFYQAADFTVLPSVSRERLHCGGRVLEVRGGEGFPRTHLEAMCFGLPIVGTTIAGVPEQIVTGHNGVLVPPSDPRALADAIEPLLRDEDLRRSMGERSRRRVAEKFSIEQYISGVTDVYNSLAPLKRKAA